MKAYKILQFNFKSALKSQNTRLTIPPIPASPKWRKRIYFVKRITAFPPKQTSQVTEFPSFSSVPPPLKHIHNIDFNIGLTINQYGSFNYFLILRNKLELIIEVTQNCILMLRMIHFYFC